MLLDGDGTAQYLATEQDSEGEGEIAATLEGWVRTVAALATCPGPLDNERMVECVDDLSIADTARLWRRVAPDQLRQDGDSYRPSSGVFATRAEMSVHLADLTSVEEVARNYPNYSIVQFTVALVRELKLRVVRDPQPDESPPDLSHAIVCPRASGSAVKRMARACTFVKLVPPPLPRG